MSFTPVYRPEFRWCHYRLRDYGREVQVGDMRFRTRDDARKMLTFDLKHRGWRVGAIEIHITQT